MLRLTVLALAAASCSKPAGTQVDFSRAVPANLRTGPAAVTFENDSISVAELNQRFAEMNPYARARYQTVEQRRDYVEGLVRFELLSREAIKRGLQNDPDVVEAAKRVMVQELLKTELDERADAITDAQVKSYYDAHRDDYVKPAMTRLAHIAFAKADRTTAETVLAQAKALQPMDYAGFGALARTHSIDTKTKVLDGDLRFLSNDELETQLGPEVKTAAAALEKLGDVGTSLVETAKALHILKLEGRQQPLDLSLEQASPSIRQILLNETRQERYRTLLDRLKREANVQLSDDGLAKVVVDPKAPTVEAKGPQPGFVPGPQSPPPAQ